MAHSHHHDGVLRGHAGGSENRIRLSIVLAFTLGYMVLEVFGGLWSGSLALLADAGHMLSDAGALTLTLFALWIAARPANPRRTYGYYRIEILTALVHGAVLLVISFFILSEAYQRWASPPVVQGSLMLAIAVGGLVINGAGLWLLRSGQAESLNIRGAWLHLWADAMGSIGVIVSALLVWLFGFHWADPAASVVIALLVAYSAWPLLAQAVGILMESAPKHIDVDEVRNVMAAAKGVIGVHDLHVWCITEGRECLSGHVVAESPGNQQNLLRELRAVLHERFGISHITLQIEASGLEEEHLCS